MSRMPKVRWVTALPPNHAGGGGHLRQAHLLDALFDRADVTIVVVGHLDDDALRSAAASVVEVDASQEVIPDGAVARRVRMARHAVGSRDTWEIESHRVVRAAVAEVWPSLPPADVVAIEFHALAPLVDLRRGERWAITFHNVVSRMLEQQAAVVGGGRRQRWFIERERSRALRRERWAVDQYDLAVAVSSDDALLLGTEVVVENGVDRLRLRPTPVPAEPALVFTGALYTLPNIDGINWFCREVLPLVQEAVPLATLEIVGSQPDRSVRALEAIPGVSVIENPPDILPYLDRARVAVVPLRIGSGSRLKALEAMAVGRPLAGTGIGFEGLDVRAGAHALISDDPAGLARAVVRLLEDDEVVGRLAKAGRDLVDRRYGWDRIAPRYVDLLLDPSCCTGGAYTPSGRAT